MGKITFTFAQPIKDLDIVAEVLGFGTSYYDCNDPATWPTYIAYGPTGLQVDQGSFEPPVEAGCTTWASAGVDLYLKGQISKVEIFAPTVIGALGYGASYRMAWNEICKPVGLPVLDDPAVQHELNEQHAISAAEGLERGGYILEDDVTGARSVVQIPGVYERTACHVTYPSTLPAFPGATIVAMWHTHDLKPGVSTDIACPGERPPGGKVVNGPSGSLDRPLVRFFGLDSYIIDHNEVFYVFTPQADFVPIPWAGGCRAV
jgi:hypothetical protein